MILPNETAELKMNAQILLVEDEPGLVLTLTDLFRGEGYEVETALEWRNRFAPRAHPPAFGNCSGRDAPPKKWL